MITGKTKITGIFGYPVEHTKSPAMHNSAFQTLGLDFAYLPFNVSPDSLKSAVESIRSLNIAGVNITVPHKVAVMKYLDKIDKLAKAIGSVNTIVNKNGTLTGYNTDGPGFLKDLKENGFNPKNKTILLLGAGGAGKAVAAVLSLDGAKQILITDIDSNEAALLAKRTKNAVFVPFKVFKNKISSVDLIVNTTPIGMHKDDKPVIEESYITKKVFVYDVIYNRETELIKFAKKKKAKYANGLGMLLYQGVLAFELWTGKKAPVDIMKTALSGKR